MAYNLVKLSLLASMMGGCTSGPPGSECPELPPTVALTQGQDPSADLEDGDGIVMVHGPQGGWHVEVGLRVSATHPRIELDLSVDARGTQVVFNHYEMRLLDYEDCTGSREGLFGFLDVSELVEGEANTPPELLIGEELFVVAEVLTESGTARDEVRLIAEPDPKDVED